jgi:hypothetical protein
VHGDAGVPLDATGELATSSFHEKVMNGAVRRCVNAQPFVDLSRKKVLVTSTTQYRWQTCVAGALRDSCH